jgi:hypothetical protein
VTASTGQEERLSSRFTFIYKFMFPTVWLGGFGIGTALLVLNPPQHGPSPLLFVAGWMFGGLLFLRSGFRLKKVTATARGLLVSNYRREVLVPYDQIAGVRENKFMNIRPITVELRSAGEFGRRFVFMPYTAFNLFADHPAATAVRQRVDAARQT